MRIGIGLHVQICDYSNPKNLPMRRVCRARRLGMPGDGTELWPGSHEEVDMLSQAHPGTIVGLPTKRTDGMPDVRALRCAGAFREEACKLP
jgi:hypothetical protein